MKFKAHTWQYVDADMVELGLYVHPEILSLDDADITEARNGWTLSHECGFAIATFATRDQAVTAATQLVRHFERLDWRKMDYAEVRQLLLLNNARIAHAFSGLTRRS